MVGGEGNVGVASGRIFGNIGSGGDSEVTGSNSQIPPCPVCGDKTQTVWRAGTYRSEFGVVIQRWLCRFLWKSRFALTKINDTQANIFHKNHPKPTTTNNTPQKTPTKTKTTTQTQTQTKPKQHRHLQKPIQTQH